jgi:hypothetical protein
MSCQSRGVVGVVVAQFAIPNQNVNFAIQPSIVMNFLAVKGVIANYTSSVTGMSSHVGRNQLARAHVSPAGDCCAAGFNHAYVGCGSRSEEFDLSISGPLLSPKAVVRADMPGGRVVPTPDITPSPE